MKYLFPLLLTLFFPLQAAEHAQEVPFLLLSLPGVNRTVVDACVTTASGKCAFPMTPAQFLASLDQGVDPIQVCEAKGRFVHVQGCFNQELYDYLKEKEILVLFCVRDPRDLAVVTCDLLDRGLLAHHWAWGEEVELPETGWGEISRSARLYRTITNYLSRALYRQSFYLSLPGVRLLRYESLVARKYTLLRTLLSLHSLFGREGNCSLYRMRDAQKAIREEMCYDKLARSGVWKEELREGHRSLFAVGYTKILQDLGYNGEF